MTEFFELVKQFFKQYWPGLAVMFFNYEEARVDHEKKEKEAAELVAKNLTDEKVIRDQYAGKSDADIISSIASEGASPSTDKPKPE